jgi:hypothetical protein
MPADIEHLIGGFSGSNGLAQAIKFLASLYNNWIPCITARIQNVTIYTADPNNPRSTLMCCRWCLICMTFVY